MHSVHVPTELTVLEILKAKSLSPRNYQSISIKRARQVSISSLLISGRPYDKGEEPGSGAYVDKSDIRFLRNSCINKDSWGYESSKLVYLNPHYTFTNSVSNADVLLCKDANIGDACLYVEDTQVSTTFSSGVVRLNFKEDHLKFYCLAFLRDEYFRRQLDFLTPKGATIRHAGDRFLKCRIPFPDSSEDWVYAVLKSLVLNLAHLERLCRNKLRRADNTIGSELLLRNPKYEFPTIALIAKEKRCDAGIYSPKVYEMFDNIDHFPGGSATLDEFGFILQRGPNLAKRDLGRSIQSETYRPNYHVLVYPSDIAEAGYLLRTTYLGARNPIWYLKAGDILFAAEGTVGKTFVICDETYKFTTNFHGMIIHPKNEQVTKEKSVYLGLFLNFLRAKGILSLLAVGGQGGSFAVGYWNYLRIPCLPQTKVQELNQLYDFAVDLSPLTFDLPTLERAGIYQLNAFRILCESTLTQIISDMKEDSLQPFSFYESIPKTVNMLS